MPSRIKRGIVRSESPHVTIANNIIGLGLDRSARLENLGGGIHLVDTGDVVIQNNSILGPGGSGDRERSEVAAIGMISALRIDRNQIRGKLTELQEGSSVRGIGISLLDTSAPVRITANQIGENAEGIRLDTAEDVTILGNLVGSEDGSVLPNGVGIAVSNSSDVQIGTRERPNTVAAGGGATTCQRRITFKSDF